MISVILCPIGLIFSVQAVTEVDVTIDARSKISLNTLSLGFMLDYEWKSWRDTSVRRQLAVDANFKMVRLFSHRMEPCTLWYESNKTGSFSWANVDLLIQRIFEVGAEPIITLGFCNYKGLVIPPGMAINPATGLPYPESFAAYCREWVRHFKAIGVTVRYYEIFNEAWYYFYPNWNWNDVKAANFLKLFNKCYDAMHAENPQVLIGNDAALYRAFLDYWIAHGGKLDLLTFHKYDSWGLDYSNEQGLQSADNHFFASTDLELGVKEARQKWFSARNATLPIICSESNWSSSWSSGSTDPRIQQLCGVVWAGLTLRGEMLNGVDYNCYYSFSSSKEYALSHLDQGYGFGMVNEDNNQPWYPYYVQKMIGTNLAVGDSIVDSTSSSSDVRTVAWKHGDTLNVLLICKVDQARNVNLHGLQGTLNYSRIDNRVWWETPRVQTGSVDSATTLSFIGYTVILLQSGASASTVLFEDGFESANFAKWTGTVITSGETVAVARNLSSQRSHVAAFTSSGLGGWEYAYCFRNISPQYEIFARGYFYVDKLGISENDDRFYFIRFSAGGNNVAAAGWRQIDGLIKWCIMISPGSEWTVEYASSTPTPKRWYCVELHWVQSNTDGYVELYIDGILACAARGLNTTSSGSVNLVRFGLAELYGCNSTQVYCDYCKISEVYIGPFPPWDLNQDGSISLLDLFFVSQAFGSKPGSENWNPQADLGGDQEVSITDLVAVAIHFGEEYS